MRKNAVNRELRDIPGGVCAPSGFKANGVHAGFTKDADKKDLALVVAERRCPTACVFSINSSQNPSAFVSKKHSKRGLARAVLINSGVANLYLEDGVYIAEKVCRVLAKHSDVEVNDLLLASTGQTGSPLSVSTFENGIPMLVRGLDSTESSSLAAAEGITSVDERAKQLSFAFDLGDFSCKIGAIYKGKARVCPNMATTLAIITCDICITSDMLQRALSSAIKDTFNMICVDGISSPNDTVYIMANGKAGNYKVYCEDSEYEKFLYALKSVLMEICKRIVKDGDAEHPTFLCEVSGVKSKQAARAVARRLSCCDKIKRGLLHGSISVSDVMHAVCSAEETCDFSKMQITLGTKTKKYVLYGDGRAIALPKERILSLFEEEEIVLSVEASEGNFRATTLSCFSCAVF